jgi:hypothetical protein
MKNEIIKAKLKQLNITEETICSVNDFIISLQLNDEGIGNLLFIIEKVTHQHHIRELIEKDMMR